MRLPTEAAALTTSDIITSTPVARPNTDKAPLEELDKSLENEIEETEVNDPHADEEQALDKREKDEDQEEEGEEDDSLEWELRNTDSVFSELSELSRDFVESVDHGANVRGEHVYKKQQVRYLLCMVSRG